jgi:exodeoxyribonuclease V beta subunit
MQKHSSVAVQKITPESDASHKDENDNNPPPTTETLLKRGNVSGNVFHEIMETLCNNDNKRGEVDFETACEDGMAEEDSLLRMLIRQVMRRNVLSNREKGADSTEKTLLRMVQNALNTEITIGGISFKLKDIPRQNRMAEVEFVADENKLLNLSVRREGSLNGKIDLLVRVGDKVVILDWKTNSLSDYTDSNVIKTAMDEADYHLQYQLYSLAVHAWLKSYGLTLCGAAYLFVRGGEFGTDRSGLFVAKIDAQGVEQFRTDISAKGIFAAGKEAE